MKLQAKPWRDGRIRFEPQRGEGQLAAPSVAPEGLALFLEVHPGFRQEATPLGYHPPPLRGSGILNGLHDFDA